MANKSRDEVPQFSVDPRQKKFYELLAKFKKENPDNKQKITNCGYGYWASSIDLGWLQNRFEDLLREKVIGDKSDFSVELNNCVQRVASHDISEQEDRWKIMFTTTDDHGHYGYSFWVMK